MVLSYKKPASAGFLLGVWFGAACGRFAGMRSRAYFPASIIATLLFCASMVQAQQVWRGIDADGLAVYSDRAQPEVRAMPAPEATPNFSTVPGFLPVVPSVSPAGTATTTAMERGTRSALPVTEIAIQNPKDQDTIRDNRGEFAVNIEISPRIVEQILRLQLWLDGELALESAPDQRSFLLRDVPRGTHQLELRALLADGVWRRSSAHTVFLHRASRLH